MQANTIGRVKNVRLSASKPLSPLFEAIVNSIDAIEERGELQGQIMVSVSRDDDLPGMKEDSMAPCSGIRSD